MNKPQPQTGPEIEEYSTTATPKAYAGSVPVFCAHDAIVPLKDLRPNPKNPNQHPPEQIKLLASIIRATGWRAPITVSKRSGLVTKGHGRLMAAQLDDLTDAPVDYQDYASEAEELADLTADNRIAELATTDNKMLAEVFADIDTGEIPFMLSGYTEDDYGNIVTALSEALHTKEPSSDPDAEIPTPAEPVTQYGDLWILGRHRVLCGDCTRPEDRALLLDGNKPEILLTDPPYCSGGSKESQKSTGSIGTERKNGKAPKIANDILSTRGYASWTGHISHGNTYHLRQNMDAYFFSYFPELKPSPKGDTTHGPKTEQPRKQVEGQVRQPVRQPDRLDRGR